MANIQIFNNPQFGEIRTAGTPDEPLFCLADVCKALDLRQGDVRQRLSEGVVTTQPLQTAGGIQQANFINEDGLYDVILDSRKPEAKAFRKWITSEVIPSIRKNGGYIATTSEDTPEMIMARALKVADLTIKKFEEQNRILAAANKEMKPKALFAEAVSASTNSILVGELAKILKQNGIEIGQNRLFAWLRDNKYLMRDNIPYQQYMEMGLFEIKENTIVNPDGSIRVTKTTKVTGKGQIYFVNKFIKAA